MSVLLPKLQLQFAKTRVLDPRISFTRNSLATCTNKYGLLELLANNEPRFDYDPATLDCKGLLLEDAATNICPYPEDFAKWPMSTGQNSLYTTRNYAKSPCGLIDADLIIPKDLSGNHYKYISFTGAISTTYTASCYFKADGYSHVAMYFGSSGFAGLNVGAWFNLSTGTIGTLLSSSSPVIRYVGGGWYRCSVTATSDADGGGFLLVITVSHTANTTTITGDGKSGVLAWGAQLEVGDFATTYIPNTITLSSRASTATYINYLGRIASATSNTARLEYNASDLKVQPRILVEDAATNLLPYSEQANMWNRYGILAFGSGSLLNTITAPDGTITAEKVVEDTGNTPHASFYSSITVKNSTRYTHSVFAKAGEVRYLRLQPTVGISVLPTVDFDLVLGTIVADTSKKSAILKLADGWYRCAISFDIDTGTLVNCNHYLSHDGGTLSYVGDGVSGLYLWGAQLEEAVYSSSGITQGTVQSGSTTTTIILDPADTKRVTSGFYVRYRILINGEYREITAHDGTTYTVTLSSALSSAPGAVAYVIDTLVTFGMTSYIPTAASTASRSADVVSNTNVTRSAEYAVISGTSFSSWFNASEGTIRAAWYENGADSQYGVFTLNDGSGTNMIDIRRWSSSTVSSYVTTASTVVAAMSNTQAYTTNLLSAAMSYKTNDCGISLSGSTVATDTAVTLPAIDRLQLGGLNNAYTLNLNGWLHSLTYYDVKLTDTELQKLSI